MNDIDFIKLISNSSLICLNLLIIGRTQVLSSPKFVQHPHALAIFEDMIYYSDRRLQRLQVYPKYPNGTSGDYPSHTFSKALGVTATHPVLQPKVHSNPCAGNPCSHLCLIGKEMVSVFVNFLFHKFIRLFFLIKSSCCKIH